MHTYVHITITITINIITSQTILTRQPLSGIPLTGVLQTGAFGIRGNALGARAKTLVSRDR